MTTLTQNNEVRVYVPTDATVTVTPGTGGYVEFGCSVNEAQVTVAPRLVYTAATISIPAGSTVVMRAVGAAASYTSTVPSAAEMAALQVLTSANGSLATPLIVGKSNTPTTRTSVNGAGDTTFTALTSFVIPGGSLGPNGALEWELEIGNNNTAVVVEFRLEVAGTAIAPALTIAAGAANFYNIRHSWENLTTATQRYRGTYSKQGSSTTGYSTTSIDTSVDITVDVTCRWQSAVSGGVVTFYKLRALAEYGA